MMTAEPPGARSSTLFQRLILPGLAFKAVVIGGGYATGRELAEFLLGGGPVSGLMGLGVTAALWSAVCIVTFLFARVTGSYDYRRFFEKLLGPAWPLFEIAYICLMLLVLAVFGAAAGEIFATVFSLPHLLGMLALAAGIVGFATFGNESVEALFKYVSIFLYLTYAAFFLLVIWQFGGAISTNLAASPPPRDWFMSGITYGGYNLLGAVVILPVIRHLQSRRDAVIAGMLCGPLATLPAFLFFLAITAFYPEIQSATLPSDYVLVRIGIPLFHLFFQIMVLTALLESGTGLVHALNERLAGGSEKRFTRLAVASTLVLGAMFVAARFGLIDLIAKGYGASAYLFLAIYVLPLFTIGLFRVLRPVAGSALTSGEAP